MANRSSHRPWRTPTVRNRCRFARPPSSDCPLVMVSLEELKFIRDYFAKETDRIEEQASRVSQMVRQNRRKVLAMRREARTAPDQRRREFLRSFNALQEEWKQRRMPVADLTIADYIKLGVLNADRSLEALALDLGCPQDQVLAAMTGSYVPPANVILHWGTTLGLSMDKRMSLASLVMAMFVPPKLQKSMVSVTRQHAQIHRYVAATAWYSATVDRFLSEARTILGQTGVGPVNSPGQDMDVAASVA